MRELVVTNNEEKQRIDRFLGKYMKNAPKSFIAKNIRKKNIKVNGNKVEPSYMLQAGDVIKMFLAEETIRKFSLDSTNGKESFKENILKSKNILFEDENILAVYKLPGILTHGDDLSVVEIAVNYMKKQGSYDPEKELTFRPSCCNRLDKNTSGIVIVAKNNNTLIKINQLIRERNIKKYYIALIKGVIEEEIHLGGYIEKDKSKNISKITTYKTEHSKAVETHMKPLKCNGYYTLMEIDLITGRSHQIRAHLKSIGKPIIGDSKYGDEVENKLYYKKYGLKSQLLHNRSISIKDYYGAGKDLAIIAPLPELFDKIIKDQFKE
ncbi:RluA family pseudouridine synthase [Alkalibacter mobilis]|uniref:RluA family pseudouridine synthase n=1 Tax=Alkalibacter mobilis TaxID=2787712 RepID=UPI00189E0EE5|nr:RluA family pseudouridine synthase [Alkalibacter mobilis]MBF7096537.1 RluA family pseudouridine synthase [Alkalibacter mobilis]